MHYTYKYSVYTIIYSYNISSPLQNSPTSDTAAAERYESHVVIPRNVKGKYFHSSTVTFILTYRNNKNSKHLIEGEKYVLSKVVNPHH